MVWTYCKLSITSIYSLAYNFTSFKSSIKETEEWLKREFSSIRTGRATSTVLDAVKVEAYGSLMAINEIANISTEDARSLRILPWDMTIVKDIEKALIVCDLGLSVTVDDKGLRLSFPELTSERRIALIKIAKQKLEEGRVALRGEREKVLKDIDRQEKEGEMSEDEKFRSKAELQKILDETNRTFDEIFSKKEKEITE